MRQWRADHSEKAKKGARAYRAAHPDAVRATWQRYRARRLGNGVFVVTAKDERRLRAQPCYLCGVAPSEHIDHIIALSRGGRHSIGNLAGACANCNLSKGAMHLIEFRRRLAA